MAGRAVHWRLLLILVSTAVTFALVSLARTAPDSAAHRWRPPAAVPASHPAPVGPAATPLHGAP
jgi:hypothetical protein